MRYGLRQLRRSPGFTAVAVITLALGIGATTAIFSVVNGVLLRPLPYAQPDRLVSVQEGGPGIGNPASYLDFFDWQAENHIFSEMASYHGGEGTLTGGGEPLRVHALVVSSGLFEVLKAKPLVGRGFEPQDDQRGADVVVFSHSLWRQRFNSDPAIVGHSVELENKSFRVIGVMPAGFQFPPNLRQDLWMSVAVDRESGSNIMTGRGFHVLSVVARLKPGVSLANAQADMDLLARRLARQYPESNSQETTVRMMPEAERVVGSVREPLLVLLGAVAGVLLIACVNVASLLLARNLARRREVAVRSALGAHRARVFRQLLTETLMLAFFGGVAGIALAAWGTQALMRFAPEDLPRIDQVGMDWRVLAFAVALALLTGLVFGSLPALGASRTSLAEALKEAGRTASEGVSQRRLRGILVVTETALALVLLVGAGLLLSSYERLTHVDPGFDPANLLTFSLDLPTPPHTESEAVSFMNQLLSRLRTLHGVRSAALDWTLPFSGGMPSTGIDFEGRSFAPGYTPSTAIDSVTPDYFQTMRIPLLRGRTFTDRDNPANLPVAIVNEAFARHYFPNESTVGKRIKPSFSATSTFPWREVVGVVGNTKLEGLAADFQPEVYMPFAQTPTFNVVILRVQGDPLTVVPAVRSVIASMDKNVPVYNVETVEDYLSSSVARNRFSALLLGLFGALALVLAAVGIYGVVSHTVSQGWHEMGIRVALGAQRSDLLWLVVGRGMGLVLAGASIGLVGALGLTRFLSGLLYRIKPTDPLTFAVVWLVVIGVAFVACYLPARRATKVDPMVALRYE
ncbi:MAG TPA: ABC transporter permease [Terriglobia bacterium]|nr:ABC transporter permease [Terriglobia bacterium]